MADDLRQRMALSLDVDDLVAAQRLAKRLKPWFGIAKVGLELYSATGPDAVVSLTDLGFDVWCDIKLHDIPTTVGKAARVVGGLGARYVTVHTAGGVDMVRAGVEGLNAGAVGGGWPEPIALGVTVLTSDRDAPPELLAQRIAVAVDAGCRGVVCAVPDVTEVSRRAPGLLTAVQGIRLAGTDAHDQGRVATPEAALKAGADIIGIGRAVTAAADPEAAAATITDELVAALTL
ncbi:MAG: orotidine-5'-phosphate decarboxylase [Acidimicrobiales bacterium]